MKNKSKAKMKQLPNGIDLSQPKDQKKKKGLIETLFGCLRRKRLNYLTNENNEKVEKSTKSNNKKKKKSYEKIPHTKLVTSTPEPSINYTNIMNDHTIQNLTIMEGWIKIANKSENDWDVAYAVLTGNFFKMYPNNPNDCHYQLLQFLELNQENKSVKVILEPLRSEIDIPVEENDLKLVLKIEILDNVSWSSTDSLALMATTEEEKEKWFKALQSIVKYPDYKYKGEIVFTYPEDFNLNVNCLVELNGNRNQILFGTNLGLFSYKDPNNFVHISGPVHVQQIVLISPVSLALMIVNKNRTLVSCDLNLLYSLSDRDYVSKPYLPVKTIEIDHLDGFQTIKCSDFVNTELVCVATKKQIIILKYEGKRRDFSILKMVDTEKPTSCISFLEHSLVVGAGKIFELNLRTLEVEKFIDESDSSLIRYSKSGSFPLYVATIFPQKEYLLCYDGFAVFVNIFGRATRDVQMKWLRLPRGFHYSAPYLYVVQLTAIEVFKIGKEVVGKLDSFSIECDRPRLLGSSSNGGIYVGLEQETKLIDGTEIDYEFSCISLNLWSKIEEDDDEVVQSTFTFT